MIAVSTGAQGKCLSMTKGWLGEETSVAEGTGEDQNQPGEFKAVSLCCHNSQIQLLFIYLFELQGIFKL